MTDDIEARRGELEAQLWAEGHNHGAPTFEAQMARAERIARLQAALAALPPRLEPTTGEQAGIVQIGAFLGDPWTPPAKDDVSGHDDYEPLIREYGERIK